MDELTTVDFSGEVMRRFAAPAFATVPADAAVGRAANTQLEVLVEIHLRRRGDGRLQAGFLAHGCPATIACADWVAERADGATAAELAAVSAHDMELALQLPSNRVHCAVAAVTALRRALERL